MLCFLGESSPLCTLRLGDHAVLVANGGAPEAEYALFDPAEIELAATEPGIIREVGFRTTVGSARERLVALGFTAAEAHEAATLAHATVARAYARGAAVRRIAPTLGAAELFDGGRYDAPTGVYEGAWLDLAALARDLAVPAAGCALQACHLAALFAEHDDEEAVVLSTAELTAHRKAGERTFRRPRMGDPGEVLRALSNLHPGARKGEGGPGPREILSGLRAWPRRTPAARERMRAIEAALAAREAPARGPLADPELWAIDVSLSEGDPLHAVAAIDAVERRRGRIPATTYLRARAALLGGTDAPRAIAERASALSTSLSDFHELQLLSAQAWAAAGEPRRAAAFARDLVDNASASDCVRMQAQDLVGGAGSTDSQTSLTPVSRAPVSPRQSTLPPPPAAATTRGSWRPAPSFKMEAAPITTSSLPPPALTSGEPLESLGLPAGAQETSGDPADPPRTPLEARVHCTLLTRELGRALRDQGAEACCDIEGLEIAQRYLREAIPEAGLHALRSEELRLVNRNGALLAELLARKLAARWADLGSTDPQRWAMLVPSASRSEVLRVWPFARVARFAAMGHKERDLVSYYLEVEARTRGT